VRTNPFEGGLHLKGRGLLSPPSHEVRKPRLLRLLVLEEGVDVHLDQLEPLLGVVVDPELLGDLHRDLQVLSDAPLVDGEDDPPAALGADLG